MITNDIQSTVSTTKYIHKNCLKVQSTCKRSKNIVGTVLKDTYLGRISGAEN